MIDKAFHQYIKDFILKSGEELEWNQSNNTNYFKEVKIIKRSERIYRILGLLSLSIQMPKEEMIIDPELESLAFTTRKKIKLDDRDRQTFKWLEDGWIIKEVRFEKDEKTVSSSHYRMGFRLYQYEMLKFLNKEEQTQNEFIQIKNHFLEIVATEKEGFLHQRELGLQSIINVVSQFKQDDFGTSAEFPKKWSLRKRLKYLHFVSAFCRLSIKKEEFDWKEIGASYFQKIGGSKEFDSNKNEFLEQLEEWASVPLEMLGLISLGQITPVFFAGQLNGRYATYSWGPVHALTNSSIINESFQTKATTLWLVENRAILTRMAATKDFLKETNSLIICIDGHLRSAHKNAISQILSNSQVEQVIIWSDFDSDGFQISKELHMVIDQFNELTLKWILPDQQVTYDKYQYEQYLANFLLNNQMEQEQMMGGADNWKRWILD